MKDLTTLTNDKLVLYYIRLVLWVIEHQETPEFEPGLKRITQYEDELNKRDMPPEKIYEELKKRNYKFD